MYPTKEQLLAFASQFSKEEGFALLFSGGDFSTSTRSFLGLFPRRIVHALSSASQNPWNSLSEQIKEGFWFGYLSYEMGLGTFDTSLSDQSPLASFVHCAVVFCVDHVLGTMEVRYQEDITAEEKKKIEPFLEGKIQDFALNDLDIRLKDSLISAEEYEQKIEIILEEIKKGNVYQVNLSHRAEWINHSDPFQIYCHLLKRNPVPFSAFLNFSDKTIVSLSPERFLSLEKGLLASYPIKGTAARGESFEEDQKSLDYLLHSEKEKAELLMITDLMRNDLGKVCKRGSVKVPKLASCEAYTNVFHMNSVIEGIIDEKYSFWEVLAACFPAGSITGCPKKSAMKLINKLEQSTRGVYTGAIGYIDCLQGFDFNVAIRTLEISGLNVSVRLGGGITIDSNPFSEYQETLHKGKTFFNTFHSEVRDYLTTENSEITEIV